MKQTDAGTRNPMHGVVMRQFFILLVFVYAAFWWCSYSTLAFRASDYHWKWTDGDGRERSDKAFYAIVQRHKRWLDTKGKAGERANLRGANISGQALDRVDLSRACMEGITLKGTTL